MAKTNKYATYNVQVTNPKDGKVMTFTHGDDYDSITLTRLMNFLAFANDDRETFNANFVSIFNAGKHEYEYFVERLVGTELGNISLPFSGQHWAVMINGEKKEWHDLHSNEVHVMPKDEILWVFE